ncbi:hypothetical protein Pryu01_03123 [Paraliobacillus ryukyuensis]|uniref:Uncharacterized protein n=1 Tax=Paraliobacillus ryukyuensis TaxID=200904 RepID=A0A366DM26_9BACI|nr:hypothetical protein [Paraliobacillus ryukyuensis]RBO91132.1 hypothetical protein DES48_12110 [Paraliobacillus ryukyuensis]
MKRTFLFLSILAIFILSACGNDATPNYEIVENDSGNENVLYIRAVTDSRDEEELKDIAKAVSEEIVDTDTFEGLNTYAAFIRIHEKAEDEDFGGLLLSSKIAYRSEGLPITGLDETDKLEVIDVNSEN